MSLHDILLLSKQVILSWQVLVILFVVFLFISLIFYIANYHKDVLDYSIPITKETKKNAKKNKES
ncbi:MAG: hypothetical protein ACTTJ6_02400 [Treponema sp.]